MDFLHYTYGHVILFNFLCALSLQPCYWLFANGAGDVEYFFHCVFQPSLTKVLRISNSILKVLPCSYCWNCFIYVCTLAHILEFLYLHISSTLKSWLSIVFCNLHIICIVKVGGQPPYYPLDQPLAWKPNLLKS